MNEQNCEQSWQGLILAEQVPAARHWQPGLRLGSEVRQVVNLPHGIIGFCELPFRPSTLSGYQLSTTNRQLPYTTPLAINHQLSTLNH